MRSIRKILVAVKNPGARNLPAVDKAVQLARAFGAEIELYHGITERVLADPCCEYLNYMTDFERRTEQHYRVELETLASSLRERGVKASATADWDYPPHEALVRRAQSAYFDLIVAECHAGRRRAAPWLLHLTDWELIKTSPVPVLLVKNASPWRRPVILAALDPAHERAQHAALDREILQAGAKLSDALEGSLQAMHSFMPVPPAMLMGLGARATSPGEVAAESEERAARLLRDLLERSRLRHVQRHLVPGRATEAIPRVARDMACSILVMGAVSRSGLKRVFIGNTAERVLDEVPCDVLVVKPPGFKSSVSRRGRGIRYVGVPDRRFPH